MAKTLSGDAAKRLRRKVERAVGSIKPTTPARRALLFIAVPIAGAMTEQAIRAAQQKGPELASKGVEFAKEKLPVAAEGAKNMMKQLSLKIHERRSGSASGGG
jgi:hypothetical protein